MQELCPVKQRDNRIRIINTGCLVGGLNPYHGVDMKAGKISESILKRSVLKQLHREKSCVLTRPGVGADYASVEVEADEEIILAVNPVTRTRSHLGMTGVYEALNNVACSGAKPVGVMVSLLIPTSMNEQQMRELIQEIDRVCEREGATVLGGHTEVTRLVKEPLITLTGVGKVKKGARILSDGVRPGMDIIVSKWIALEGTAILATEKEQELLERYAQPFLHKAQLFREEISILPEAAVAAGSGVKAMHDVSEGGIFGALWELAQGSGVGLEIDLKKIPIRQETVEICEFFDINPYKLISGGCLLMAAEDGNEIVRQIISIGGHAAIIGKATDSNDRVIINEDERRFLETTQTDELYKVME